MIDVETITGYVTSYVSDPSPILWIVIGAVVLFVIFFVLRQFLDVLVDVWKLPFVFVVDFIDMMAYNNPYLDLAAAFGAVLVFWILAKRGDLKIGKFFGAIAAAEALIGIWILPQYAFVTNLLPVATILMIITIWND